MFRVTSARTGSGNPRGFVLVIATVSVLDMYCGSMVLTASPLMIVVGVYGNGLFLVVSTMEASASRERPVFLNLVLRSYAFSPVSEKRL